MIFFCKLEFWTIFLPENSLEQEEDLGDLEDDGDVTEPYDPNTYRLTPLLYSPGPKRKDNHEKQGTVEIYILYIVC